MASLTRFCCTLELAAPCWAETRDFDIIGSVPSLPIVCAFRGLALPQPGAQRYLPTLSSV